MINSLRNIKEACKNLIDFDFLSKGKPNKTLYARKKPLSTLLQNTAWLIGLPCWSAGSAFAYTSITVAKSTVRIGVLKSTAQLPRLNAVLFCVHGLSVMTGCVGVSKDTPSPVERYANLTQLVTLRLASLGDEFQTQSTGGYQNA